jgi:chromosome segregation ATPase
LQAQCELLGGLRAQCDELQAKLDAVNTSMAAAKTEAVQATERGRVVEISLEQIRISRDGLQKENDARCSALTAAENRVESLQSANIQLEDGLRCSQRELSAALRRFEQAAAEEQQAKLRFIDTQADLAAAQRDVCELRSRLHAAESTAEQLRQDLQQTRAQEISQTQLAASLQQQVHDMQASERRVAHSTSLMQERLAQAVLQEQRTSQALASRQSQLDAQFQEVAAMKAALQADLRTVRAMSTLTEVSASCDERCLRGSVKPAP